MNHPYFLTYTLIHVFLCMILSIYGLFVAWYKHYPEELLLTKFLLFWCHGFYEPLASPISLYSFFSLIWDFLQEWAQFSLSYFRYMIDDRGLCKYFLCFPAERDYLQELFLCLLIYPLSLFLNGNVEPATT